MEKTKKITVTHIIGFNDNGATWIATSLSLTSLSETTSTIHTMIFRSILQGCLCATFVGALAPSFKRPASQRNAAESWRKAAGSAMLVGILSTSPVYADQIGVEKEAPTLYTGETVEVRQNNIVLGSLSC